MAKKLTLKEWSEKSLTKDDWNFSPFSKLPKSAISRVYQWELDRELGSGKGPFASDANNKKWLANISKGNYEDLPVANVTSQSGATFKTGKEGAALVADGASTCLLYTSPSPRDGLLSRMPSSA